MKIPYYPGCAMKTVAQNCEIPALAVAEKLGVTMVELPRWNCCGVFPSLAEDDLMRHVAPIRNLIRVQEMNKKGLVENEHRVVALCSMCFHTLKEANLFIKDGEKLEKINTFMDREEEYKGGVKVLSFLELLKEVGFEKVAQQVKKPLKGLKVAPYYGCLVLRPKEIGIGNPQNPTMMEDLLEALGAEVIDNPCKAQCCGSYHTVDRRSIVAKLTCENLIYPIKNGAEMIATCCPLCTFNLDRRQVEARGLNKDLKEIPIVYYTQLMALALGLDKKFLGLDLPLHHVDPRPLLEAKNLF